MEAAKRKFEDEKSRILKELPQSIKDTFGTMGFCPCEPDDDDDSDNNDDATNTTKPAASTTTTYYTPILIVSPYDVPPKPVRDIYWMDYFQTAKKAKTLSKLQYLVYHYGKSADPDECYSFCSQDDFVSCDIGMERGYHTLPTDIVQLLDDPNATLTEQQQERVRALQEFEDDLDKAPQERKRGVLDFCERHEKLPPKAKKQKKL